MAGDMTLEGSSVRLVPMTLEHVPTLARVGADPELWAWTTAIIRDEADARAYVETALSWRAAGTAIPFVTTVAATGEVIGSTRFANLDAPSRRVEIGWTWIARPWQRTAVNTEAKLLMLRHAFEAMGMLRVELKTDAMNWKSRNAIVRIGGVEEGTLRSHTFRWNGERRDTVYFSILADEWPTARERLEARLAGMPAG